MIRKIIDSAISIFFIVCFVITGIVAIAQNSVPGDITYGVKTGFEKIVLISYRLVHKDTDYQIDLTKLRFKESKQVIQSAQSANSFENLNLQILTTTENITNIQDPVKKSTYAKKYINTLKEMKAQLDYEKVSYITSNNTSTSISISSTDTSDSTETTASTNTTDSSTITDQIDETQQVIEDATDELDNLTDLINYVEDENTTGLNIPTLEPTINVNDTSSTGSSPDPEEKDEERLKNITPTPTTTEKTESAPNSIEENTTEQVTEETPVPTQ